jgi:Putative transmembrane protein (PGPGW)
MRLAFIRRIFVAIAGFTVLLIGLALIVLPGPALVVIPLGLAILATEFVWARALLKKARGMLPTRQEQPGKNSAPFTARQDDPRNDK